MRVFIFFLLLIVSNGISAQMIGELGILDLTANGGINPQTGSAWAIGDTYRLIFVSSTTRNATSTNIADYNSHVQSAATAAGLGSVNWYAIASTSTVDAVDNTFTTSTDTDGALFLMNGTQVVANDIADFWDGTINTQIDLDENGSLRPNDTPIFTSWTAVWTGTKDDGTADDSRYLGGSGAITFGLARAELKFWERRSNNTNSSLSLPIYGVSEVLQVRSSLPVDLLSFDAKLMDGDQLLLNWQTASEQNNDFFTIERSRDGLQWEILKEVAGVGTSSSVTEYEEIDPTPYLGVSYYRLKQTDFNGQFSYSKQIAVSHKGEERLRLYPNPARNIAFLMGTEHSLQDIKIFNAIAQDVTHLTKLEQSGEAKIGIDTSGLSKGMYVIRVKNTTMLLYKVDAL
ncbi:MAG: T9SS type A sorting domain-containing protein [Bacteroidota bacterium]